MHPNGTEMHQNMSLGLNGVDRERSLQKILTRHRGTNFCINCTSLVRFAASFVQYRNGSKCPQTERNAPKHEFRDQWCGSGAFVAKNSSTTSCRNICINCTSSAHFAPSLVQQRNWPKCTQTLRNTLKHEFRVQFCGSGVLTGSDVTSWHELLH